MQNKPRGSNTQEVMNRATDTSLQVQETAIRTGRAAGQIAGGVALGAMAALWRFGGGLLKGGIEGGKVGLGQFVQATDVSLRQAGATMKGEESAAVEGASCSHCGNGIEVGSKFCNHCGQPQ